MPREKKTVSINLAVHLLLDESGSMQSFKLPTINGANAFIEGLTMAAAPANVSVLAFGDTHVRTLIDNRPAFELPTINGSIFRPAGGTPLCRAMGESMERLDRTDAEQKCVIVLTDGQSDGSSGWPRHKVKDWVGERRAKGWLFLYLGIGSDPMSWFDQYGFLPAEAINCNKNVEMLVKLAAMATLRFQTGEKGDPFTKEEREMMKKN